MKKIVIRLILAMAIVVSLGGFIGSGNVDAAGLAGWANQVKLTLDHTKIGSTLSNFPVLVNLSASSGINKANLSSVFSALGSDTNRKKIAVTTADGTTQCYVEIEKWDTATKQAVLWVKVPSISNTADTALYLYYDANQADNTTYVGDTGSVAAQNVWSNGFVMVQHLSQQGTGTIGEYQDSTSHRNNGQGGGGNASAVPTRVTGKIGYAQQFDGSQDFIKIPDSADFSKPTTGSLTISVWLNPTTLNFTPSESDGYSRVFSKQGSGQNEWGQRIYSSQSAYGGRTTMYGYNLSGRLGIGAGITQPGAVAAGQWTSETFTFGSTAITSYLNAGPWGYYNSGYTSFTESYSAVSPTVNMQDGTAPVAIGAGSVDGSYDGHFYGSFDEIRISNVVRSADWIKTSYYSESDNLLYFVLHPTPVVTSNAASSITTDGATLNGNLTNKGSAGSVSVSFEFGTTASYGSTVAGIPPNLTNTGIFTAGITSLTPNTLYHYRAVAVGDGTAYGSDMTFNTTEPGNIDWLVKHENLMNTLLIVLSIGLVILIALIIVRYNRYK